MAGQIAGYGTPGIAKSEVGEVTAASLTAGGGEVSIDVYRSGYFNANALNFDSTVNTFALQEGLFDGGPELLMIGQNPRDVAHQAEVDS